MSAMPLPCCEHCGCGEPGGEWPTREGHDDTCASGCNDHTAYCSVCREDVPVTWAAPPYSVGHVLESDPPLHLHPITKQPAAS